MRRYLLVYLFFSTFYLAFGQYGPVSSNDSVAQQKWVEETYATLTLEEKIGQLFMVMGHSDQGKAHADQIQNLIADHQIGGVIFFDGWTG